MIVISGTKISRQVRIKFGVSVEMSSLHFGDVNQSCVVVGFLLGFDAFSGFFSNAQKSLSNPRLFYLSLLSYGFHPALFFFTKFFNGSIELFEETFV